MICLMKQQSLTHEELQGINKDDAVERTSMALFKPCLDPFFFLDFDTQLNVLVWSN